MVNNASNLSSEDEGLVHDACSALEVAEGIVPDILTTAKGISSAYVPLGLTATTQEIASFFDDNYFAFNGGSGGETPSGRGWRATLSTIDTKV